jgi:hypothetical protein
MPIRHQNRDGEQAWSGWGVICTQMAFKFRRLGDDLQCVQRQKREKIRDHAQGSHVEDMEETAKEMGKE